ncbi:uncharacterized protein LOC110261048 isoform X5 [Sus scrofa]|uniref:uncharacterized protein LOC110261048 isoform X5 n=1 Tax=Sus scrofa TaxID=9823 RepID=UPI000A2AF0CB|nr:uncharacterized protein LOC110261048 isoform X5 [Sus scrofa]
MVCAAPALPGSPPTSCCAFLHDVEVPPSPLMSRRSGGLPEYLPEIYLNPPENGYLPIVIGTSAISVLPLFLLFLLLCHCWCRAKHRATDDETKSQVQYDSSGPGLNFAEDNQSKRSGVSVDIASEGDRQMDMEALPEEDPQDVISVQQH